MDSSNEQRLYNASMKTVKIVLFVMLIFCAFVFIYYGLINRSDVIERESIRQVKDWAVKEEKSGDQLLTTTLPQDVVDNEYLYFDTRKDASVYINGELRKDFIEERDVNIPGAPYKRFYMSVPLKESDSGAEITVVRHAVEDVDKETPDFFIGTRTGTLFHFVKTDGLLFVLSFIILIFSFVAFVVSIVLSLMYKQKIDMLYGALGIFTIAAWLITDSFLFPYVFGVNHVNGILSFMFCSMIPLGLVIYLSSLQKGKYKKFVSFLMIVAAINAVGFPILHFTGILPFYRVLNLANGVLVFLAVSGIGILVVDVIRRNTSEYKYTCIGFMGFLIGCLIELMDVILEIEAIKVSIPIVIGLGFLLTFIVIQQVHDLRKINMEKQRAIDISEAKTRFLASMSHEIRTPINAILGMNEMILRENKDRDVEEYSRSIKTSGKMLLMLVNDVLDFTKIESGKLEIRESEFLMSDMLYDVTQLIRERADEKQLALSVEVTGEVPNVVISDEFRIRQIIVNLMNNAVKYTETGTITLAVGGSYNAENYELSLRVKDTGKGIRPEEQEHLFEAFSRADVKSNANIEGTGLGLAIVKSIVDSMGGEVGVESEYGVGSEFWVKLPVKYNSGELLGNDFMNHRPESAAVAVACSFTAPDAKILAVDDNQSNLTIVKLFLKRNGIVPDLCSTGTHALRLCKEKKYDLILMDHMMPEPDGIETLHMIREDADSLNKDTKAVVLTANAVAGSRQMYMNEGFDDYLTKPLDAGVLEETVKKMLPQEKVKETGASDDIDIASETTISGKEGLASIEGLDYKLALSYCADEEDLLMEIVGDVSKEGPDRAERMREFLAAEDYAAYKIEAHSIKGTMLTIGLKDFSERAKRHEFAARDNDTEFIKQDADAFIDKYLEICKQLGEVVMI